MIARGPEARERARLAYARSALLRTVERIAAAREGARATTAYTQAFLLAQVPGIDLAEAEDACIAAAKASGLPEEEARAHVVQGLRRGAAQPRRAGPANAPCDSRRPESGPGRPAPTPRGHPPREEVLGLWAQAGPCEADEEVAAYLRGRGLDPMVVDMEVLARVLPRTAQLPKWAHGPAGWWHASGYRLLLPAFDAAGDLVTVRARRIRPGAASEPKVLSPAGYAHRDAVYADLVARRHFAGRCLGACEPCAGACRPRRWIVVEGDPDYLTWGTRRSEADEAPPAVLGLFSGAWCASIAARIPDGAQVALRLHDDEAGRRYRAAVVASLKGRVTLLAPDGGPDGQGA